MSKSNVRAYTDQELLERVKSLDSFVKIPGGIWILGVRSNEDAYDVMDDKFYIFKGEQFIEVLYGTTNSGGYGLLNYRKWNKKGVAQIKADEWYYSVWKRGKHNGKMDALRQDGEFKVIRDGNKNKKSGDVTEWTWEKNNGLNFHTVSYNFKQKLIKWTIGRWSVGCQVVNNVFAFANFMRYSKPQKRFTYCLINEF
jgi:hypothetical protein